MSNETHSEKGQCENCELLQAKLDATLALMEVHELDFKQQLSAMPHSEKGLRELVARLLEEACYIYEVDNGIVMRYVCQFCQLEPAKRESVKHLDDCPYHAAEQALAATPAVPTITSTCDGELITNGVGLLSHGSVVINTKDESPAVPIKWHCSCEAHGTNLECMVHAPDPPGAYMSPAVREPGPAITEAQAQDAYCDSFDTDAPAVAPAPDFKRLARAINRFLVAPSSAGEAAPATWQCPECGNVNRLELFHCENCKAAQFDPSRAPAATEKGEGK